MLADTLTSDRIGIGRQRRMGWRRILNIADYPLPLAAGFIYSTIAVIRHVRRDVGIDAAIFFQAIDNYAHLREPNVPIKSVEPFSILGDHFSPALVVFAPLVAVAPRVLTLLICQAVLFAVAVAVVQHTADSLGLNRLQARLITAAYGLSSGMMQAADFDFHEVSLTVPVAAVALSLLLQGKQTWGIVVLLSTLLIREDNAFLVAGVGLSLLIVKEWRVGLALLAGGIAAFFIVTGMVIPHFSYYGKYTYWSSSGVHEGFQETARAALSTLSSSMAPDELPKTAAVLLLSFLFLPLRSRWAAAAAILLLLRATSPNSAYWGLNFHYNAILSTIFAFAAVDALLLMPNSARFSFFRPGSRACSAGLAVAVAAVAVAGPAHRYLVPSTYSCDRCPALERMVREVPAGSAIAADAGIVAMLVERHPTYLLAPDFLDSAGNPMDTEWVLLDLRAGARPQRPDWAADLHRQLTRFGHYAVSRSEDYYVLLRRVERI
jgi:hypothetical protein